VITRDLRYCLTTVAHPDHPDRLAHGVLVYFQDDQGKPIDVGIIEQRDPTTFSIQADSPTIGITTPDLARILRLMMHLDAVIANLKQRARDKLATDLGLDQYRDN
jgi:hypothetical protein